MNKNKKAIASRDRLRATFILAYEFSDGFFHPSNIFIINRVAKLLKITPDTVKRYLRENELTQFSRFAVKESNMDMIPDRLRAILILEHNAYNYKDIGEILHIKAGSVKREKSLLMKKLKLQR